MLIGRGLTGRGTVEAALEVAGGTAFRGLGLGFFRDAQGARYPARGALPPGLDVND